MQQPHYNKDLEVRQIGPEDLARARLVAGRAFMGRRSGASLGKGR